MLISVSGPQIRLYLKMASRDPFNTLRGVQSAELPLKENGSYFPSYRNSAVVKTEISVLKVSLPFQETNP
jgi:hypothetical protein